jgi:hypothetical protein
VAGGSLTDFGFFGSRPFLFWLFAMTTSLSDVERFADHFVRRLPNFPRPERTHCRRRDENGLDAGHFETFKVRPLAVVVEVGIGGVQGKHGDVPVRKGPQLLPRLPDQTIEAPGF